VLIFSSPRIEASDKNDRYHIWLKLFHGKQPDSRTSGHYSSKAIQTESSAMRIVKSLLGRKSSSSISDRDPAEHRSRGLRRTGIKLKRSGSLVGRKEFNSNISTEYSQTPLALAAENGHDRVVRLLQARHTPGTFGNWALVHVRSRGMLPGILLL